MIVKIVSRAVVLAGLVALAIGSLNAGTWSHTLSSPGSYSANVTVPSAGSCTQICEGALASNTSINTGPIASLVVYGIGYQTRNGAVAAGTYYVYQAETVTYGGFSTTVFNW